MASLSSAFSTVASGSFVLSSVLVAGGFVASGIATDWMRSNVVDIGMKGGDALYALVGATVTMAFLPAKFARPLALGMVAGGANTAARAFGVL